MMRVSDQIRHQLALAAMESGLSIEVLGVYTRG